MDGEDAGRKALAPSGTVAEERRTAAAAAIPDFLLVISTRGGAVSDPSDNYCSM